VTTDLTPDLNLDPKNILPREGEAFYFPQLFSETDSSVFFAALQKEIQWKQEPIRLFGKMRMQPRLTALYGEPGTYYRYSGIRMTSTPWTETLQRIRNRIEPISGTRFSLVLLNYYRDENDSMGWHSDDEKELGPLPTIASVSFGATRRFHFRHRNDKNLRASVDLENGSLLVMRGESQASWQHAIPKKTRPMGPRINLTFRVIL
jgi:alkylated DNA repair dioxygenase AlkB